MRTYYVVDEVKVIPFIDGKVSTVFFDLENYEKDKRQPANHIVSQASFNEIPKVRDLVKKSELMIRLNPVNDNTKQEIKAAKDGGADIVMLPYFKYLEEVKYFSSLCGDSLPFCLLVETPESVINLRKILWKLPVDRVHFGLNDLKISLGRNNIFETVFDNCLIEATKACIESSVSFGIGGVGSIGLENPTPKDYLTRCIALGAKWVILNRSFADFRNRSSYSEFANQFDYELERMNNLFDDLKASFDSSSEVDKRLCKNYLDSWYRE